MDSGDKDENHGGKELAAAVKEAANPSSPYYLHYGESLGTNAVSANQVSKELTTRFSESSNARVYALEQSLVDTKQGDDKVAVYFAKLKGIWDEITACEPITACKCVVCPTLDEIVKMFERRKAMQFLMGLRDEYSNVRNQVLLEDPLPALDEIFNTTSQEESKLELQGLKETQAAAVSMHCQGNESRVAEELSDSQKSQAPPWIDLPIEVTENILSRLSPDDVLFMAERVCTTWQSVCMQPSFWRVLHVKGGSCNYYEILDTESVFYEAVNRSQGELIDVNIKLFGNDATLQYVTERSSCLKILSIQSCDDISPRGLIAALKNVPHLEELHLFHMNSISPLDIESIGVSCPMLKSFTLYCPNLSYSYHYCKDKSNARSIAEKMPNLVRLCLFGNLLNNKGLLAILNGCPNLESLDLRECYEVNLQRDLDLGRRCSEQIKEFRCVLDFDWQGDRFYEYDSDDDSD